MNTVSTHFQPFVASPPRGSLGPPATPTSRPATAGSDAGSPRISSRPWSAVADLGGRPNQVSGLDSIFGRFAAGFRSIVSNAPRPDVETPDRADTQPAPDRVDLKSEAAATFDSRRASQLAPDRPAETPSVVRADTQPAPDRVDLKSEAAATFDARRASQLAPDRPAETPSVVRADTQLAPDRVDLKSEAAATFDARRASQLAPDRPAETPDFTRADTRPVRAYRTTVGHQTTVGHEPRVFDRVA